MARIPNFGKFKDTLSEAKKTVSAAASTAAETASKVAAEAKVTVGEEASSFAAEALKTAGEASRVVAAAATEAANSASKTINEASQTVYDAFNKEETFEAEYEQVADSVDLTTKNGTTGAATNETNVLIMPNPAIDDGEFDHFRNATARYQELLQPGAFKKTGETLSSLIPKQWKEKASQAQDKLSQQDLYEQTMKVLVDGFGAIEDQASRFSVSEAQIINEVNVAAPENTITRLNQVCLVRSHVLNKLVDSTKNKDLAFALAEGATTGAAGFVGIPFNLVLSTFLYYRAVQSVAQYYGFDVKNDPMELVVAGEVFARALNPDSTRGELTGAVEQIYTVDGVLVPKSKNEKGWHAVTGEEGVPVVIQNLRNVSTGIAKRALSHATKEELEKTLFQPIFEQVGRSLAQSTLNRSIPVFSAVFSAVFDTTMMNKIVDFANVFYAKRFILEKEMRLEGLSATVASVEVDV